MWVVKYRDEKVSKTWLYVTAWFDVIRSRQKNAVRYLSYRAARRAQDILRNVKPGDSLINWPEGFDAKIVRLVRR